jgi:hypothetical protein
LYPHLHNTPRTMTSILLYPHNSCLKT